MMQLRSDTDQYKEKIGKRWNQQKEAMFPIRSFVHPILIFCSVIINNVTGAVSKLLDPLLYLSPNFLINTISCHPGCHQKLDFHLTKILNMLK